MATLQIRYPMLQQIETVLLWKNEGTGALDPMPEQPQRRNDRRTRSLRHLRGLTERLSFTDETTRNLIASTRLTGRHIGALPVSLLDTLVGSLRQYGYIYPNAVTGSGTACNPGFIWEPTPLTGQQLHIIRLLADGWDTTDISESILTGRDNINACLRRALEQTGCSSRAQLMATVFRRNWFPSVREERSIRGVTVSPCLGYMWVPANQKDEDEA